MNYYPTVIFQQGTFYNNSPCGACHLQENQLRGQSRMTRDYCLPEEQHTIFSLDSSPLPARCGTKRKKVFIHGTMNRAGERDRYDVFDGLAYNSSSQGRKNYVHIYDDEDPRYGYGDRKEDPCARPGSYYEHEQNVDGQSYRSRTAYSSQSAPTRQATEADSVGAEIPSGYSIKHWDQTEEPVILLGSVFDANSLGKWVYDWAAFHHGASTPMADMAGDLWLLLIKLAGKMKLAQECVDRIRNLDKRETVEDFILSGHRMWNKFKNLIKDCKYPMLRVIKRNGAGKMGKEGAIAFLDTIFGRDRHLETTEHIMNRIRHWTTDFDLNCEETIKAVAKCRKMC